MQNIIRVDFQNKSEETEKEIAALASMLIFAKDTAKEHEKSLAAYLIDLAIAALREDNHSDGRKLPTA